MSEGEVIRLSVCCENCVVRRVANPGDIGNAIFHINDSEGVRHFSSNCDQQRLGSVDNGRKVSWMRRGEREWYEKETRGNESLEESVAFTSHLVSVTADG